MARSADILAETVIRTSESGQHVDEHLEGERIHIDVKKLGRIGQVGHRVHGDRRRRSRGIGWEFLHVCVDDATRLAYPEVLADEHPGSIGFLERAINWLYGHDVTVERLMTDNGNPYRSRTRQRAAISQARRANPGAYT